MHILCTKVSLIVDIEAGKVIWLLQLPFNLLLHHLYACPVHLCARRHFLDIKGEGLHIVLSTPIYLLLPLALVLVFRDVIVAELFNILTSDLIRGLHMHPLELSEAVGYSLLFARHLTFEVHVGLRYLVTSPLVLHTQFLQ